VLMLFEKGRWRLSCMCAYACVYSLFLLHRSSSFKYFELRIRMMKRSIIR
jgi:hypothetical protein